MWITFSKIVQCWIDEGIVVVQCICTCKPQRRGGYMVAWAWEILSVYMCISPPPPPTSHAQLYPPPPHSHLSLPQHCHILTIHVHTCIHVHIHVQPHTHTDIFNTFTSWFSQSHTDLMVTTYPSTCSGSVQYHSSMPSGKVLDVLRVCCWMYWSHLKSMCKHVYIYMHINEKININYD